VFPFETLHGRDVNEHSKENEESVERMRTWIEALPFRGEADFSEGDMTGAFVALKACEWQSPLRCLCVISDVDDHQRSSITSVNDIADKISELGVDLIIARLHQNEMSQEARLKLVQDYGQSVHVCTFH
jgi:hypothetical protein